MAIKKGDMLDLMKNKHKIIIYVVPLIKIPLTREQSFCYLADEKLPIGTLVTISIGQRKMEGVVIEAKDDFQHLGNIKLKKIEKTIEKSFLIEKQIKLAKFISEYYISPLGIVMKGFAPKRVKARNAKRDTPSIEKVGITLTKEQQEAVEKIRGLTSNYSRFNLESRKFLLFGPSSSGKTEVYIHSILRIKESNPKAQFLILVPEQTLTPQAIERYGAYFKPEEIVVLSSNISKGQYYSNWEKIRSGETKIILGTRMAVFAPFKKLGLIVIDEEQDMSYKQWDMNPRYDARAVAEKLAEMHKCPIVRGSATPSIETYFKAISGHYKLLELPVLNLGKNSLAPVLHTAIVDMKKERWDKNYTCISKKLKSEIAYALKNKQQSVLFINRQGMSSFSICAKCKTVLKCPRCDRALIYDNKGVYRCAHCSYQTSIIPECSHCRGIEFINVGLGTQKVEREISGLFPGARTARVDNQTAKSGFQEKIYREFSEGKIDILIGTQMISKGWDLPSVALVGIIDTDNMLSIPDFSVSEKFYQNIVQVSGRVSRLGAKFPGAVVIQTFRPELKSIKSAAERDYESFYGAEIKERKALNFPPLGRLIKLVFQEYALQKVGKETERVYEILKNISDISVSEPQDAFVSKVRGRFRKQMVIKFKGDIPEKLRKILKNLGAGWIIDIDPISIT